MRWVFLRILATIPLQRLCVDSAPTELETIQSIVSKIPVYPPIRTCTHTHAHAHKIIDENSTFLIKPTSVFFHELKHIQPPPKKTSEKCYPGKLEIWAQPSNIQCWIPCPEASWCFQGSQKCQIWLAIFLRGFHKKSKQFWSFNDGVNRWWPKISLPVVSFVTSLPTSCSFSSQNFSRHQL